MALGVVENDRPIRWNLPPQEKTSPVESPVEENRHPNSLGISLSRHLCSTARTIPRPMALNNSASNDSRFVASSQSGR